MVTWGSKLNGRTMRKWQFRVLSLTEVHEQTARGKLLLILQSRPCAFSAPKSPAKRKFSVHYPSLSAFMVWTSFSTHGPLFRDWRDESQFYGTQVTPPPTSAKACPFFSEVRKAKRLKQGAWGNNFFSERETQGWGHRFQQTQELAGGVQGKAKGTILTRILHCKMHSYVPKTSGEIRFGCAGMLGCEISRCALFLRGNGQAKGAFCCAISGCAVSFCGKGKAKGSF